MSIFTLSVVLIHLSGCACITRYKDANDSGLFGDSILSVSARVPYYADDEIIISYDIKKKSILLDKESIIITPFFSSGDTLYPVDTIYSSSISYKCNNSYKSIQNKEGLYINIKYKFHFNDKIISSDSTFLLYKDEDCQFSLRLH